MPKCFTRPTLAVLAALAIAAYPASAFEGFQGSAAEGSTYPEHSNGAVSTRPSIQARALGDGQIRLDGRLDEPVWREAEPGTGFRVWDPSRGAAPSEETVFKVAYDEHAIYFGVAALEKDPGKIQAKLSRRDRFTNSDVVAVYVDPYFDHTTGYSFKVNPLGVQLDTYVYNDGDQDQDWDAVWEAETHRDSAGWYAEIRIPFSAIRYRAASSMTWGLQVYRYMHGRGEDTAWVVWDRATNGFVSRFGELRGIERVPAPRQLEILPYVLQRTIDPADTGPRDRLDRLENFGADLKYGVTSDLTLNATANPDFGQVEADPAVLNLSPFETFFQEKRPFFVEGNRFFEHPQYSLFYSRRIGTGEQNSRIRYAAKLTGKTFGGISVAALAASTDVTGEGQAHNLLKDGDRLSRYFVGRFGKEFGGGRHHVNLMQTAVLNTADHASHGDLASREAYTTGLDFDLATRNRAYSVQGTLVGSVVDPEGSTADPANDGAARYGTAGSFDLRKFGGVWRGTLGGRWKTARLDLNDLGYLESADQSRINAWVQRRIDPRNKDGAIRQGNVNFNLNRAWLWAARTGRDAQTGAVAWSYGRGHPALLTSDINGWMQLRSYWQVWYGVVANGRGTQRYETRGGPLISEPATFGGWAGFGTDTRKRATFEFEANYFFDTARNRSNEFSSEVSWSQSSRLSHAVEFQFEDRRDDTQYLDTVDLASTPGGVGIGGLSYVFGRIHQQTLDLTLRSSILFSRNQSLELYAQPYVTVGDHSDARELARPDTYDLVHYNEQGYDPHDRDFRYAAMNWNAVYRWQYRPGSTLFLVWTQSREGFDMRALNPGNAAGFQNPISISAPFSREPENRVLAKITYWFAV